MGVLELWYARMSEDDLQAAVGTLAAEGKNAKVAKDRAAHGKTKPGKDVKAAKTAKPGKDIRAGKTADPCPAALARAAKRAREEPRKGPHPGQPAGPVQARRTRRRALPDRQPTPDRGPAPGPRTAVRHVRRTTSRRRCTTSSGSTGPPCRTTAGTCWRSFEVVDMARKVVGVGSVGTRAFIVLLAGPRRPGPAVPAGQGGHQVGAGGPPAEEPVPQPRGTGGPRTTDDAGLQRHLPGLD